MEPNPDEQVVITRYVHALTEALNQAWGAIETSGQVSDVYIGATDAYLDASENLVRLLSEVSDPDVDSPASVHWRLAWAAAGDGLILQMIGAVDEAAHVDLEGTRARLEELAADGLMSEEASVILPANPSRALVSIARLAYGDEREVITRGVEGMPEVTGGAITTDDLAHTTHSAVDHILSETTKTLAKLIGGDLAAAASKVADIPGLIQQALHHLRSVLVVHPVPGQLQRLTLRTLDAAASKVKTLFGGSSLDGAATWLLASWQPVLKLERHVVDGLFRRDGLNVVLLQLMAGVPEPRIHDVSEGVKRVQVHFHHWNRPAAYMAKGLRWGGHVALTAPGGLAYVVAGTLAATLYVAFMAWDHLDWPTLALGGFTDGVVAVLKRT
jgi:hypothetical protein